MDELGQAINSLKKALDLSGVTGVLTQDFIDQAIADTLDHQNPFRVNFPRRNGSGEAYKFNRKNSQPAAGGFVNDTEVPTSVSFGRARLSEPFKTILRQGEVTRFGQAVGATYKDLLANEIEDTTLLVRDDEENGIINGDTGSNVKEFDGLRIQIPAGQIVSAGTNGGQLTLGFIDETIDKLLGSAGGNMMVMSKRTRRALWALLQQNQRFVDRVEVKGGFRVTAYAPEHPIFYNPFISDAQTQGTANNASDLFVINTMFVFMAVLTNFKMIPIAKISSQFDRFEIVGDETLVVKNPQRGAGRLQGIVP